MRKVVTLIASVALVGLVASMTFASASQERASKSPSWRHLVQTAPSVVNSSDKGWDERVIVVERNATETQIDNAPQGFSQGDAFASAADLYWRGKKVGYSDVHGVSTYVSETKVRVALTATATIRGDEISVVGSASFTEGAGELEFSVVGGTGRYDDVGGELNVVEDGQTARLVFDLKHLR